MGTRKRLVYASDEEASRRGRSDGKLLGRCDGGKAMMFLDVLTLYGDGDKFERPMFLRECLWLIFRNCRVRDFLLWGRFGGGLCKLVLS